MMTIPALRSYWLLAAALCVFALSAETLAAPEFPKLTGRVVDLAGVLDERSERSLSAMLQAHEEATGNQLVVATLKDIGGYDIADYGYQLGRHWDIGQKDKNNGALLILAKNERKVRIEVGYGLEGQLTDAISSNIISTIMLPAFRKGQFDSGLILGAEAMIMALGGEYKMRTDKRSSKKGKVGGAGWAVFIIFLVQFLSAIGGRRSFGRRRGLFFLPMGGGGGRSGGFGGGGGFSGGGASGGW
jgi:uncharacterized protein